MLQHDGPVFRRAFKRKSPGLSRQTAGAPGAEGVQVTARENNIQLFHSLAVVESVLLNSILNADRHLSVQGGEVTEPRVVGQGPLKDRGQPINDLTNRSGARGEHLHERLTLGQGALNRVRYFQVSFIHGTARRSPSTKRFVS